jgi:D-alanyl-D-alanine carboxypeptidase
MCNLLKKLHFLLIITISALLWPVQTFARAPAIVIDADTGAVLEAVDANARWYPASLTKVMTVYLTLEQVEAGYLKLEEELTVSPHAASQPATELGLGAGSTITVSDAILAVILQSANDAAVVLAERIGGTEDAFASRMTAKAQELGMTRTAFRNASGLPNPDQVTTARDMAVLARALLQNYPQYYHFFSTTSFTYRGQTFGTINGILSRYEGADGIKTGFTCGSGYNLIASAKRNGRRLIGVLLGSHTNFERHSEMGRLLDAGFAMDMSNLPQKQGLTDLISTTESADEPPPLQLSALECAYGVSPTGTSAMLSGGRLPGWGIIFGAFPNRSQAQTALSRASSSLNGVVGGGRPAIVPRQWEGTRRYSALLVGLNRQQAGKACKHLWNTGGYCLALSPTVLNNPRAAWR